MITILGLVDDPQEAISNCLKTSAMPGVAFCWHLQEYWRKPDRKIGLAAIFYSKQNHRECIISDQVELLLEEAKLIKSHEDFVLLAEKTGLTRLQLGQPLALEPIHIAKPWGQEIWFTGIEERGVCRIGSVPFPWLLSMAPEALTGLAYEDPVLLKILDPYPTSVYGDLYFEMHEQKQEVYVVTRIDEQVYPDGTGAIRLGFEPNIFRDYSSKKEFFSAYQKAVSAYEKTRRSLDKEIDELKLEEGIDINDVVSPDMTASWESKLSPALVQKEQEQRQSMNKFTHLEKLKNGDIIKVPTLTPHSLQHGVRVIEFQSPHYERFIISFAQKVMTQDHWDTKEALAKIDLNESGKVATLAESAVNKTQLISNEDGCRIEKIVSFDRFEGYRIHLQQGATYDGDFETYAIVIGLTGKIQAGKTQIKPEDAFYFTAMASPFTLLCDTPKGASFLLALPTKPKL